MNKHDEGRRAFLVGAAVVGAGAAAGVGPVPEANAAKIVVAPVENHSHAASGGHGAFFNDDDAATVTAFTERLWPAAPGKPGATEIGVLNYIDLALAGAYAEQQDFYRRGLTALNAYCRKSYQQPFVALNANQQDAVITALERGEASEFTWPSAIAFFNTVRTHTMEGLFADPIYGGDEPWRSKKRTSLLSVSAQPAAFWQPNSPRQA
jgi:gluconate 2-dehydrogenase gamma chain